MAGAVSTQARIIFEESFSVPPETLFAALLDHEGMSDWAGAKVTVIDGPADGGVGCVRRIHLPLMSIDERVTYVLAPRRIVYRIVRGLPIIRFHRGEILVSPRGEGGSHLTWDILLDSAIPGAAAAVCAVLEGPMRKGFPKLRARLAR